MKLARVVTIFVGLLITANVSMAQEKQHVFLATDSEHFAVVAGAFGQSDKEEAPPPAEILCTQDVDKNLCSAVKTLLGPLQQWTAIQFFVVDELTFKTEQARLMAIQDSSVKAASEKTGPDHTIALSRAMNDVPYMTPIGRSGHAMFILNYGAPITLIDKVYISQNSFRSPEKMDKEGNAVGPVDLSLVEPVVMEVFRYAEGFSAGALRQLVNPKVQARQSRPHN